MEDEWELRGIKDCFFNWGKMTLIYLINVHLLPICEKGKTTKSKNRKSLNMFSCYVNENKIRLQTKSYRIMLPYFYSVSLHRRASILVDSLAELQNIE